MGEDTNLLNEDNSNHADDKVIETTRIKNKLPPSQEDYRFIRVNSIRHHRRRNRSKHSYNLIKRSHDDTFIDYSTSSHGDILEDQSPSSLLINDDMYLSDSSSSISSLASSTKKLNHEKRRISKAYFKEALKAVQEVDQIHTDTVNLNELHGPEAVEKMILKAVDRIEDEIDEKIIFSELLPLEVKLAVEQNVFGWSNFFVDIFCHTSFTIGSFCITYGIITILFSNQRGMLDWWYGTSGVTHGVVGKDQEQYSFQYKVFFEVLRMAMSIFSAFSAFRAVRRRRRVWLQSTYNKSDVDKADKTTFLGRVRSGLVRKKDIMLAKNVQRTIKKATKRFDKKQRKNNHVKLASNKRRHFCFGRKRPVSLSTKVFHNNFNSSIRHMHEDSILFDDHSYMREKIEVVPYAHGGFFGAAPLMLDDPFWVDILRSLMPDVYCEVAKRIFSPTPKLIHWAENNPVVAAYGTVHEYIEHKKVSTIEWDVFLDPELVHKLEMSLITRDEVRSKIDKIKRTSSYHERKLSLLDASSRQQMIQFVNFDFQGSHFDEDCELLLKAHDIEVQKNTIHLVEKMLIAHGNLTQLILEQTGYMKRYVFSRVKRSRKTLGGGIFTKQWLGLYAEALQIGIAGILDNNQAGGSLTEPIKKSTKSILVDQYSTSLNKLAQSKCRNSSILDSIKAMRSALGAPLGLVLDLKSRHVSNKIWSLVINALRDAGARVEYVASFIPDEIRGISKLCLSPVKEAIFCHGAGDLQAGCHNGSIRKGDVVFFNAGSLIYNVTTISCFKKFNADEYKRNYLLQPWADWGSNNMSDDDSKTYQSDESGNDFNPFTPRILGDDNKLIISSSTIRDYKEHFNLTIGLYVQEFAIDDAATDLIVTHVNQNLDVYKLGLGWGGLNGVMVNGIHPGRFTSTDGFWNQRYGSVAWDCSLYPFGDNDEEDEQA